MSREFNTAVRTAFLERFSALAPDYVLQPRGPAPYANPGETAFAWIPAPTRVAWIILVPSLKGYNEFTIELGWSRLGRYPQLSMRPALPHPGPDRSEWNRPEYLCRLASLAPGSPEWWSIAPTAPGTESPEAALARAQRMTSKLDKADATRLAEPLVAEALQGLRSHGLPYLQAWAAAASPNENATEPPR